VGNRISRHTGEQRNRGFVVENVLSDRGVGLMLSVIIDSNEDKKIVNLFEKHIEKNNLDFEVTVKPLPVGDVVIEEQGLFVERKKLYSDFVNSLRNGHIQSQALAMSELPHPFVIVSGYVEHFAAVRARCKGYTIDQHLGAMSSLNCNYGNVRCINVENDTQLMKMVFALSRNIEKGVKVGVIERFRKTMNRAEPSIDAYLALEGVGESKAITLNELCSYSAFMRVCVEGGVNGVQKYVKSLGGASSLVNKTTKEYLLKLGFEE